MAIETDAPRVTRGLRWLTYVLLAGSALAAIGLEPYLLRKVAAGRYPAYLSFAPVAVYGAFLLVYAVDRWLLVQRRRYPPGRAFFQIIFGVVFGLLLLPSTLHEWAEARTTERALIRHPEPRVRQIYAEALGFRGPDPARVEAVTKLLDDRDDRVVEAAQTVLRRWAGMSEGADDAALRAWAAGFLRPEATSGQDP